MRLMNLTPQEAAKFVLERKAVQSSLSAWSRHNGYVPASHHELLIQCLEKASSTPDGRYIFNLPPGTAKSTYSSQLYPPWYIAQPTPKWLSSKLPGDAQGRCILACSANDRLVNKFGRDCRNRIRLKGKVLGYTLKQETQASDEWETSNGGRYFAASVNAGIAGHRADLGLIDDYCASEADADSITKRETVWNWYLGDFLARLRPGAAIIIIATRRHEDDLAGRILATEGKKWTVIKLPWQAKDNDPLGRMPGERIWPEYTTDEMDQNARKKARIFSSQYQQEPTPEDGDVFQDDWLIGYTPSELPKRMRIYCGSDHAISKKEEANRSVFLPHGICENGFLWLLPDAIYGHLSAKEQVDGIFKLARAMKARYGNVHWTAEKCHISQALGPYILDKMRDEGFYFNIDEVTPSKDKRTRASSIAAMAQAGMVRYPHFAPWWPAMRRELLGFDNLGEDDFVDAHAHVGRKVDGLIIPKRPEAKPKDDIAKLINEPWIHTRKNMEAQQKFEERLTRVDDN